MSKTIKDSKDKFQYKRNSTYFKETDKKVCMARNLKSIRHESKQICKNYLYTIKEEI